MSGNMRFVLLEEVNGNLGEYLSAYNKLQRQLHGDSFFWSLEMFVRLRKSHQSETVLFAVVGDKAVGTAQATLSYVAPKPKLHVENVVVDRSIRGRGVGRSLLTELIRRSEIKWRMYSAGGNFCVALINSPKKENADFYRKLGFRSRTEQEGDPTVVWVRG